MTDVTTAKQAEENVRQSERELRQILDFSPWHVAVLEANGKAMYLNKTGLDYHGLTPEAFRDYDPRGSFHPDDRDRILTSAGRAKLLSDQPFEIEARLAGKDGKYRWFLFRFNPLQTEKDASRAGTSLHPTSRIANRQRRDFKTKTLPCEKKSTRHRCSKRLLEPLLL